MAKIPFDIKFKPQIESGEYKVETEEGSPARIICWDSPINNERPIIAIVFDDQIEQYKADGRYDNDYETSNYDLFIVTPEEELSEFEKACMRLYNEGRDDGFSGDKLSNESLKESASELLELARKELEPEILERIEAAYKNQDEVVYENGIRYGKAEALRTNATKLTENLVKSGLDKDSIPYHLIEFMCNLYDCPNWIEIEEIAEAYTTRIKAAALKDLPRWKKCDHKTIYNTKFNLVINGVRRYIILDGYMIDVDSLKKLPGFKEDSHE